MKRTVTRITAALIALAPLSSSAKTVDEATAKTVGCHYLKQKRVSGVQSPADLVTTYAATSQIAGKTVVDYYVFNIKGNEGFVLVSADDLVMPVLAYSDESSFYYDQIAPSAASWLGNYQKKIAYVIENNLKSDKPVDIAWKALLTEQAPVAAKTTSVTPMVTTKWNQNPYYNAYCPGSGSSKAVTGCVATAMAQVMKFWNWPKMGDGMHRYEDETYGWLSANFGTTAYQWTSMPNTISGSNPAIATLMSHCGISVNMHYGTAASGGSGAWPVYHYSRFVNSSEYAFETYFHYKSSCHGLLREGDAFVKYPLAPFTDAAWIAALQAELTAGRPFIYTGNDGTSGGHAWVCDGFQSSDNFFHFNWGWGGSGPDGYYSIDDVAPPSLGTGGSGGNFNFLQTATIGIEPDTYTSYTDNIKLQRPIEHLNSTPLKYSGAFAVKTRIKNERTTAFTGDICAQIYDNTTLMGTIQTVTGVSIAAGDSSAWLTFSSIGIRKLLPKTYVLKMMYKNTGSSTWMAIGDNDIIRNYSTLDVKNDTDIRLYDSLKLVSGHPMAVGGSFNLAIDVTNRGADGFFGTLRAQLVNINTGTVYPIATEPSVSIPQWDHAAGNLIGTNSAPNGMYALELLHQYNSTGSFHTTGSKFFRNPILVQVGTGISTDVADMESLKHQVIIYPNPAKDMITLMFNDNNVSQIAISDVSGRIVEQIAVDPNASSMQISVSGYAAGTYIATMTTDKETITQKISIAK